MGRVNKTILRAGLDTLYFSGGHRLANPFFSGIGAVLTFHHVRPRRPDGFQPNRSLEITPEFLEEVIVGIKRSGIELVTIDEAYRRLAEADFRSRFVALTFDDGYSDNLVHALPILKRHGAPVVLYAPSSFADGSGDLWWIALERAVAASSRIEVTIGGEAISCECADDAGKDDAFRWLYWSLRGLASEPEMRAIIDDIARRAGVDTSGICRELCLDWTELKSMASEPLVTIGAHTHSHIMLRRAPEGVARAELKLGVERLEAKLGVRPKHLAFPVGDPTSAGPREFAIAEELGFLTSVTTRPGVLFAEHRQHLQALPRISVNGEFQRLRYLDVLLSGAPTALMNGFRRVNAA